MKIEFVEKNGDHDNVVIDIYYDKEEAFETGMLFEKITARKLCVWRGSCCLRIPLMNMDETGLAETFKKKESA